MEVDVFMINRNIIRNLLISTFHLSNGKSVRHATCRVLFGGFEIIYCQCTVQLTN